MSEAKSKAAGDPRKVASALTPGPFRLSGEGPEREAPASAVAAALTQAAASGRRRTRVHLASSERRAEEIGRALAGLAPSLQVLVLPPWDCLPYDRASPSKDVMARRMGVLAALVSKPTALRVIVVSPEALSQRLPPHGALDSAFFAIGCGDRLDRRALMQFAGATGYATSDRIDEPGAVAMLGEVIDVFPADRDTPVRISLDADDRVEAIRTYDPLTQRTTGDVESIELGPASEVILKTEAGATADAAPEASARPLGLEHELPDHYGTLVSLFELAPQAVLSRDPQASERLGRFWNQVEEAFEARMSLGGSDDAPAKPERLYLPPSELDKGLGGWDVADLPLAAVEPIDRIAGTHNPGGTFCRLVAAHRAGSRRVIVTGLDHERRTLNRALKRGLDEAPAEMRDWAAALAAPPGALLSLSVDLDAGFVDPAAAVAVIAAPDVLGDRLASRARSDRSPLLAEPDLRLGDVVIHEAHGSACFGTWRRWPLTGWNVRP